jgi:hypothetical protein
MACFPEQGCQAFLEGIVLINPSKAFQYLCIYVMLLDDLRYLPALLVRQVSTEVGL